jgi:hypothetical protein
MPTDHYVEDLRELERDVNGMTYKVSYLDPDHKAKALAEGRWLVVSLSDRPKLGWVRSGVAYDPKTNYYYAVCHASVGVPPHRFRSFDPEALEFARTGSPSGGEPVVVSTTTQSDPTAGSRLQAGEQDLSRGEGPLAAGETLFDSLIERIERAYDDLEHRLGWRFLYTPRRTLDAPRRLLFVGTNPGGSSYEAPQPSVETGNAYRVETHWGSGSQHQSQVRRLYEELARRLERDDTEPLMDETLVSNFCPFRSPSWDALVNRERSVAFSQELWRDVWHRVLGPVERPVMICNGIQARRLFRPVLERPGARLIGAPERGLVGWGQQTYELAEYDTAVVVTLPHLSRFAIFGRPESQRAVDRVVGAVAGALRA